jgi:AAA15 family ATPase/GTPase
MIDAIRIQRFRCFEELHAQDCRRVNVIVGDNGTGKTSLLEATFMALGVTPELGIRFRQQRGMDGAFSAVPQQIEEALWRDLFFDRDWNRPIEVETRGQGSENRSLTISRGKSQLTIPLEITGAEQERRTSPITFDWQDSEGKHHVRVPRIDHRGFHIDASDEDLLDFFYFPANQTTGSAENAGRFSEMRQRGRGSQFTKILSQEYPWIRDLDIEVVAGSPVVFARLRGPKQQMRPLAFVSGGINRIVGIMLAIASRDSSVLLVDELEDGLFHTHQVPIWRAMLRLLRNYNGQIFSTTHSYEWIRALIEAAGNDIDDIALWRLERERDEKTPILYQFEGKTFRDSIQHGAEARGR